MPQGYDKDRKSLGISPAEPGWSWLIESGRQRPFFHLDGEAQLAAIPLLYYPERRKNETAEMGGLLDSKASTLRQRDQLGEAVASVVQQAFVVDVEKLRAGRNLDVRDAARS
jgi:hypothetical protein